MTNAGGGDLLHDQHSPTTATGTGWERTAWHAVQGTMRDALRGAEANNTKCLTE